MMIDGSNDDTSPDGNPGSSDDAWDASGTGWSKVRENKLRRAAERQGLLLHRSKARDPRALSYGKYSIETSSPQASTALLAANVTMTFSNSAPKSVETTPLRSSTSNSINVQMSASSAAVSSVASAAAEQVGNASNSFVVGQTVDGYSTMTIDDVENFLNGKRDAWTHSKPEESSTPTKSTAPTKPKT